MPYRIGNHFRDSDQEVDTMVKQMTYNLRRKTENALNSSNYLG